MQKEHFMCNVCHRIKLAKSMRKSIKGRTLNYCVKCIGFFRCNHCNKVKEEKCFRNPSYSKQNCIFDNGDKVRTAICYSCDYQINKARYQRYDKKIGNKETIKAIISCNFQKWKNSAKQQGYKFDLTQEYLIELWQKQKGLCFYTGTKISLKRGRSQWVSASLDKLNPNKGYIKENVAWTTRIVNTSKHQRTMKEFIAFCKQVVNHFITLHSPRR